MQKLYMQDDNASIKRVNILVRMANRNLILLVEDPVRRSESTPKQRAGI